MAKNNTATATKTTKGKKSANPAAVQNATTPTEGRKVKGFRVVNTVNVKPSKLVHEDRFRGRADKVGEEELSNLADSIRTAGQEQPIQVRAIEGTDTYTIIFGNSRGYAGQLIEGGYHSILNKKDIAGNPDFTLRCEVVECSDEEAFVNNVVENAHRNACTPLDNALNQQRLRAPESEGGYDMSDAAIARLYGYSGSAYVNKLKKLLTLPEDFQKLVHTGSMTGAAGILLADAKDVAEADAYDDVWSLAAGGENADKHIGEDENAVGTSAMQAAIKEWRKAQKDTGTDGEGDGEGEGEEEEEEEGEETFILNRAQFYKLVGAVGGDARTPEKASELCDAILAAMDGKKGAKAFANAILKATGETLLPKPAKGEETETETETDDDDNAE